MTEDEDKGWARREAWKLFLRCAWAFFVGFMVNLFWFNGRKPEFAVIVGSWVSVVCILESLHRAWRRRRHEAHRPSGSDGDQTNGEDDV